MFLIEGTEYFQTMFTTEMKERGQEEITIQKVDGDILRQLTEYCYSGKIAINSGNVLEMTKAADMMQFNEVKENCADFYSTMLHPATCLGILEIADLHNMMTNLKEAAHEFILYRFKEVSKCDEFFLLHVDQLSVLLANDKLNVPGEEDIFKALMDWVKYDLDGRKPLLKTLLKCVRFTHVKEPVSRLIILSSIHLTIRNLMCVCILPF